MKIGFLKDLKVLGLSKMFHGKGGKRYSGLGGGALVTKKKKNNICELKRMVPFCNESPSASTFEGEKCSLLPLASLMISSKDAARQAVARKRHFHKHFLGSLGQPTST